jgi:hypothetical protein
MLCASFVKIFVRIIGHYHDYVIDTCKLIKEMDSTGTKIKRFDVSNIIITHNKKN